VHPTGSREVPKGLLHWEGVINMKFNPQQVGVYTGVFLAFMHVVWALLVYLGLAEPFMTFVLGLHFLDNPYTVMPFSITNALILVIFVFVVGYVLGYFGTIYWNKMQKGK
jgi:membrane protein YdbS with pleckstrin-like domain